MTTLKSITTWKIIICFFFKHKWRLGSRLAGSLGYIDHLNCGRCYSFTEDPIKIAEWKYYRKMEGKPTKEETREPKEEPIDNEVYQGIDYSPSSDEITLYRAKHHTIGGTKGTILVDPLQIFATDFKGNLDSLFNDCNNLKHSARAFQYDCTIQSKLLEAGFKIHQTIEPVQYIKVALSGVTLIIGDNFYTALAPYEAPKLTMEHATRVNNMLEDTTKEGEPIYDSRSDILNRALELFFEHSI